MARTYSTALAAAFWIGLFGFATAVVGTFIHQDRLVQIGTCAFLFLFAAWAFINGGAFVWGFVQAIRRYGWQVLVENIWASILYIGIMMFFTFFAGGMTWLVIKAAMHTPAASR